MAEEKARLLACNPMVKDLGSMLRIQSFFLNIYSTYKCLTKRDAGEKGEQY